MNSDDMQSSTTREYRVQCKKCGKTSETTAKDRQDAIWKFILSEDWRIEWKPDSGKILGALCSDCTLESLASGEITE